MPLEPRRSPVQARSAASVDAILQATILQVLLGVGKERLTATRVALRAGVWVWTLLYQYFPDQSSLLQAVLKRYLGEVTGAVELVCKTHWGESLQALPAIAIVARNPLARQA